ncbi:MAG: hypothetical protein ACYC5F_04060 [Thermoleophilia bacterium]
MSEAAEKDRERCHLHAANGIDAWCTRERCIYWRLLESQDVDASNVKGCGLQHYQVIESVTPEMAEWLLSMKKRLENTTPEAGKSRITFIRREEE